MGNSSTSIRAWQKLYAAGKFSSPHRIVMIDAGWYDWFCDDTELKSRLDRMAQVVMRLNDGGRINLDTMYPWFKNNCGEDLYDDLRISDRNTGQNLFVISFPGMPGETVDRDPANKMWRPVPARIEVFTPANRYVEPVFTAATIDELVAWLNSAV